MYFVFSLNLACRTYKNLEKRVIVECDGEPIPLPSLQGIVVLNISSFMGGTNFWGSAKEDNIFLPPSFDDGILEVRLSYKLNVYSRVIITITNQYVDFSER